MLWPSRPTISTTLVVRRALGEATVGSRSVNVCRSHFSCAHRQRLSRSPHRHSLTLDRKVLKAAAGPPMPISASPATIGANADRWSGSGNNPTVIISELDAQNFDPWAGRPF